MGFLVGRVSEADFPSGLAVPLLLCSWCSCSVFLEQKEKSLLQQLLWQPQLRPRSQTLGGCAVWFVFCSWPNVLLPMSCPCCQAVCPVPHWCAPSAPSACSFPCTLHRSDWHPELLCCAACTDTPAWRADSLHLFQQMGKAGNHWEQAEKKYSFIHLFIPSVIHSLRGKHSRALS